MRDKRSLLFAALLTLTVSAFAANVSAVDPAGWDPTLARGKTKQIDFTTDEGTWMSVDVSPDGRWLVFDLLAHIYRVPIEGGEAVCLTQDSGVALNYNPRFSPDGRLIAFGSDRGGQENLWVMNADGSKPRPVFLDMHSRIVEPAWTADGKAIIASRRLPKPEGFYEFTTELWSFPLSGAAPVRLFEDDPAKNFPGAAEPSRDGRFVYFHATTGGGPVSDRWNLRRLEVASGRIDNVTAIKRAPDLGYGSKSLAEFAPKPSPDGRWLAFARKVPDSTFEWRGHRYGPRTALWLRDLGSGEERKLLDPITADATLTTNKHKLRQLLPDYNWSHDGRTIVLTLDGKLARIDVASGKVTPVPFSARVRRTISEQARARQSVASRTFPVLNPRWPATSPDGKRLVFEAVGRLWSMNLPLGTPRLLTSESALRDQPMEATPSWSADGRWVYFVTWADREGGHVWRIPANGGAAERLTQEAALYMHTSAAQGSVWAKRWPNALTRTGIDIDTPGWEVVRIPEKGGAVEVVERRITAEHASQSAMPTLPSPDGRWLVFRRFRSIYLATQDEAGKISADAAIPAGKRISDVGGDYPRWIDAHTLEWFDGNRHNRYDTRTGATHTTEVKLDLARDRARGTVALIGARVVTLDRQRRVIENGGILIREGRIAWVGAAGELDRSSAGKVIDVAGTTIVPGWFDMHTHYTRNALNDSYFQSYPLAALYLMSGITTTFEPGSDQAGFAFAMAEQVAAGRRVGPRALLAGQYVRGWQVTRSPDSEIEELATYADVERVFRRQVERGAIQLKSYVMDNRIQKQMLTDLARRGGFSITHEGQGHEAFLSIAMDGGTGMEHWLQYFPTYSDVVRFLGAAQTHYSPQLWYMDYPNGSSDEFWMGEWDASRDPKMRRFVPWQFLVTRKPNKLIPPERFPGAMGAEIARDLVQAGAYFVAGGHTLVPPVDLHYDMWTYGFVAKPMDVLLSASSHAAHMLGLENELGSLETGKIADLVVLNSNVLEDIRRSWDIRYVMKEGRLYDAQMADEVWPEPRQFYLQGPPEGLYEASR